MENFSREENEFVSNMIEKLLGLVPNKNCFTSGGGYGIEKEIWEAENGRFWFW